jgi:hypothetical protein
MNSITSRMILSCACSYRNPSATLDKCSTIVHIMRAIKFVLHHDRP